MEIRLRSRGCELYDIFITIVYGFSIFFISSFICTRPYLSGFRSVWCKEPSPYGLCVRGICLCRFYKFFPERTVPCLSYWGASYIPPLECSHGTSPRYKANDLRLESLLKSPVSDNIVIALFLVMPKKQDRCPALTLNLSSCDISSIRTSNACILSRRRQSVIRYSSIHSRLIADNSIERRYLICSSVHFLEI